MSSTADLPTETTPLIGRKADIADARSALGETRILTIVGAAGIGKTRIALRLAHDVKRRFRDGALLVRLDDASDAHDVVHAVAEGLGRSTAAPDTPTQDTPAAVVAALADKDLLLVLDTCDRVLDGCAELIVAIMDSCPHVKVVTTTREALRIAGERIHVVHPLSTPTSDAFDPRQSTTGAVELFLDRSLPDRDAPLTGGPDLASISAICRSLDGVPLAIEHAAGRRVVLSARHILERLDLELLSSQDRDVIGRHRSLRAALQWSHDTLTTIEQEAWTLLSVFDGRWGPEATAAVLAPCELSPVRMLDLMQELVAKSIVGREEADGHIWYSMLDGTRRFGRELLHQHPAYRETRARHRDWYLQQLVEANETWLSDRQGAWLTRFAHELPNLTAAVEFCIDDLDPDAALAILVRGWRIAWGTHGRLAEFRLLLNRALGAACGLETAEHAIALAISGSLLGLDGDAGAHSVLAEARGIASALCDAAAMAFVDGAAASAERDARESIRLFHSALRLDPQPGSPADVAFFTSGLALAYDRLGFDRSATIVRERFLRAAAANGERYEGAALLLHSAAYSLRRGDAKQAQELARQSLVLLRELRAPLGIAHALHAIGRADLSAGDLAKGHVIIDAAEAVWRGAGELPQPGPFPGDAVRLGARHGSPSHQGRAAGGEGGPRELPIEDAIRLALGEAIAVPPAPARRLVDGQLSARELEVCDLITEGLTDRDIAARLVLSVRTVNNHVQRILAKLGFTSRTQVAAWRLRSRGYHT
ncbi:LuxR C-terminal-related transcriptional regulator [Leifsonia sp. NCR5]|uniref:ATP-binding protein n=1 Tax=Leifsonia sp. NCR5 TaxID=1978342 RepID=UPI000A1992FC|nr:LuxR C-terminal-related transcriptional regulator [Leifsonia sp. NCR5]